MKKRLILYGILVFGCRITTEVQAVPDPMANIQPINRNERGRAHIDNEFSRLHKQFREDDTEGAQENFQESPTSLEVSPPYKRDVNDNALGQSTLLRRKYDRVTTEDEGRNVEGQCTYTFVVSQQSEHCAGSTTQPGENSNTMTELQREVAVKTILEAIWPPAHHEYFEAKFQCHQALHVPDHQLFLVADVKNQIKELNREFRANTDGSGDTPNEINNLQQSIEVLQQESRNMDSRVTQLYAQLLHEIINKRDNSLELREIQNKLLNQSVNYLKLKEDHDRLKQEHTELRAQINILSQELQMLRLQVQKISLQKSAIASSFKPALTPKPIQALSDGPRTQTPPPTTNFPPGPFRDCAAVQRAGYARSGIFNLKLPGYDKKIRVWCDFDQDPGGWIVIQRRTGRRVNFYRKMAAYKKGFGRAHSDYWLGLEHIYWLTNQTGVNFKLHVDMEDWDGRKTFVEYRSFRVEGEEAGFKLKINHYSGSAGDSLTWHNNMRFSTMDDDNDRFAENCARIHRGGWWYNSCAQSNLNGIYYRGGNYQNNHQDGVYWSEWRGGSYSLKSVAMKIRPTDTLF